jgi:hypothetical protein
MTIGKQAFYEGAALHLVARGGDLTSLDYDAPFFLFNGNLLVLLKYSTKGRSPWGFTFFPAEQTLLRQKAPRNTVVIGLICGADGVAAISYKRFAEIAAPRSSVIHLSCYRQHGEHYEINGPDGRLNRKVPPSMWPNILRHIEEPEGETSRSSA